MGRIRLEQVIIVALIAMLTVLSGCSLRKNTAATRKYQAFITRYNIYYNGDEHYKETLKQMETNYEDDYSQLLFAHPADARRDESAPQPSGDFTRSIEKAQKAIQLRSIKKKPAKKAGKSSDPAYKAWMKRDEYNPFLHNAWMMMGRSQYNNGDFLGAAATFYYITRHFSWLPATVTEARIWQARSYLSMGWDFEAENILEKIPEKELEANSQLRNLYNLVQSAYWSRSANPSKAIPYLEQSARSAKGSQKSRLNFMLGQLYQREGQSRKAYEAYKRSSTASSPYRTQINARIRQSEVYSGSSIEPEVKALRRMHAEQESLYEKAYDAYLNNRNDEVHAAYRDMMHRYPLSKIMPKFMFIDALSYVTENKPEEFRSTLKELLERYPKTDITPLASAYLKALAQGRKLHAGNANTRGMLWDLRLGNDSVFNENDSITFDLNPDVPQLLVLVYPTDVVNANQLLYDVAYHNFSAFVVRDFDLEQMNFGRLGQRPVCGIVGGKLAYHLRLSAGMRQHVDKIQHHHIEIVKGKIGELSEQTLVAGGIIYLVVGKFHLTAVSLKLRGYQRRLIEILAFLAVFVNPQSGKHLGYLQRHEA